MEEELDIILQAVDNASDTFQDVASAAEDMGQSMQDGAEAGTQGFEEVEESAEGAKDPMEQIQDILGGFLGAEVFSQLADALWDVADKAGTFEDSLMRARLEAEGAGIDVNDMTDAVSELSSTTGRAGSEIRESFIKATARGITDLDSFKQMMVGAGAQATLLGTDINTMADKMSGLAMRSTVMEKTLANTGITVEELGEALGIQGATIDDINAKWETMDTNQRAAALGMAASMNEGQTANEEYKKSWAGLQAQIDMAKGRIERLAGEVLLPVLIPALQTAARVLNWVGDVVQTVMDGPFGGLVSVIGTVAAAFALAIPAFMAVSAAYDFIAGSAFVAAAAELAALWPIVLIGAAIAALIYVVYEVGKAFGWWSDTSSMLDAIWAGVQRLWSAFINHPDVQAFIQGMKDAWSALQPYIQSVVDWVLSFFNVSSSSNFDIVRMWIDNIGMAWKAMTLPIRLVITVVKNVIKTIQNWYLTTKARIELVKALFRALPGMIKSAISSLVNIITKPFKDAYNGVVSAVNRIKSYVGGLTNINLSSITDKIVKPFSDAYNRVAREVDKIKRKASEIASNPLAAIGLGFDYEGMLAEMQSGGGSKSSMDINLNVDLANVPAGVDTQTLIAVLTDPQVLSALTGSSDFQSLDARAKYRYGLKQGRARGA